MKAIGLRVVQAGHRFSLGPARRRFERALRGCAAAQAARLRELVASNADTAYGRAHRFDAISSVRDWQGRVPIVDYDDLEPWVRRATAGEPRVLTAAPILVFERTGGSTAANKLVPYTARVVRRVRGRYRAVAAGPLRLLPWTSRHDQLLVDLAGDAPAGAHEVGNPGRTRRRHRVFRAAGAIRAAADARRAARSRAHSRHGGVVRQPQRAISWRPTISA